MKKVFLLMLIACLSMFSTVCSAQSCGEKLRAASELKKAGIANNDLGKLNQAVYLFRQVSQCDPDLRSRCTKEVNTINKIIKSLKTDLTISTSEVTIPYQGGAKQVDVVSNEKWKIEGVTDWCKTETFEDNSFAVKCLDANNSTRDKITTLKVKSGSLYKSIKVIQEGRPEYIEVGAQSLAFPAKGTEDIINVKSNARWEVTSVPSWCKIEKKDSSIHIIVTPNDRVMERVDDIVIVSPNKSVTIKVYQGAGEERLALSQNDLFASASGGTHYIKVYTDANNWFIGDYPSWMHVQKVGNDSIRIECDKNIPNTGQRTGGLIVRTDRQQVDLRVIQAERLLQDVVTPESALVKSKKVSFGLSTSYYLPFISTSAGGDYVGSVVDYGIGTSAENASYKSATGYSIGAFADIRLYKNIFMIAGLNYTQMRYSNEFNKNTSIKVPMSSYQHLKGEVQNAYTEDYTHIMLEMPILASYRFKVNNVAHVQFNAGPVFNFGISSKMKFAGNTNGSTLHMYNSNPPYEVIDNGNYERHIAISSEFNLYQPCVAWTKTFTLGNDADVQEHKDFQCAPMSKVNCGLRIGAVYEWAGIGVGLSYTYMFTNMAKKNYWENERWTVLNNSEVTMRGYSHRLNSLEFKLSYTFRYKSNQNK